MASFFLLHSTVSPSINRCNGGGRRALGVSNSLRQSTTASLFHKPGLFRSSVFRNTDFSPLILSSSWRIRTGGTPPGDTNAIDDEVLVTEGEDSAVFQLAKQSVVSWAYFGVILGVVLFVLDFIWIDSSTGFGKAFVDSVGTLSESHEVFSSSSYNLARVHSFLPQFHLISAFLSIDSTKYPFFLSIRLNSSIFFIL